jgi:hypothetical protein
MSLIRRFAGRSSSLVLLPMRLDTEEDSRMASDTTLRMDRTRAHWGLIGRGAETTGSSSERRIAGIRHRVTVWTMREWAAMHPALRPDTASQVGDTWIDIRPIH